MTPASAIASLDAQLAEHGQTIKFHTITAGVAGPAVNVRAFVRKLEPRELINGFTQKDRHIVTSPTGLAVVPEGGRFVVGTKAYRIEAPDPVVMNDVVVRWNTMARG